jgi:hypothetical protein
MVRLGDKNRRVGVVVAALWAEDMLRTKQLSLVPLSHESLKYSHENLCFRMMGLLIPVTDGTLDTAASHQ